MIAVELAVCCDVDDRVSTFGHRTLDGGQLELRVEVRACRKQFVDAVQFRGDAGQGRIALHSLRDAVGEHTGYAARDGSYNFV